MIAGELTNNSDFLGIRYCSTDTCNVTTAVEDHMPKHKPGRNHLMSGDLVCICISQHITRLMEQE